MCADADRQILTGATIHAADGTLTDHALVIEGGRIADLVPARAAPRAGAVVDLAGGHLAPGFIDLQVNGGGGVLFNEAPSVETIARIGAAHRAFGTTGFLPTYITGPRKGQACAIAAVEEALAAKVPGVLGIHLEGPHINPAKRGVHDAAAIRPLDDEDLALYTARRAGRTLITLAPECVAPEALAALVRAGVRLSAGHTNGDFAALVAALEAGVAGFTHLYNAMSPFAARAPGAVGAALASDDAWCGVIADGHHMDWASVRIACRAKPPGKLFLVTDAMAPVGASPAMTRFALGGATVHAADGRLTDGDGRLAGSLLDMATAVRNCVAHAGVPLDEALRMAAAYPADFLGCTGSLGRIAPGLGASLVWLDAVLRVRATWIDGMRADHAADATGGTGATGAAGGG